MTLASRKQTMTRKTASLSLAISVMCSVAQANETWTCRTELGSGKFHQDDYLIAEDRLIPRRGTISYKIFENNQDRIVAFHVSWSQSKPSIPTFSYFLIDRHSGRLTSWNDISIATFQNKYGNIFDLDIKPGSCTKK
jgi:hypothetical protein